MPNEPAAWMWTMLIERHNTRSTCSFPSLWEKEDDAIFEAEIKFGKVIKVKRKDPLYFGEDVQTK